MSCSSGFFFQPRQRLVGVAEYPVHGGALLVEDHLDVGKCKGCAVIAGIMPLIVFPRGRRVAVGQVLRDLPPIGAQLFLELPLSPVGVVQRFTVDELDLPANGMDALGGHQRGAVGADKAAAQHLLQFFYGGVGFVGPAAGGMDDRPTPRQLNIENVLHRQADVPAVRNDGNTVGSHSAPSRSVFFTEYHGL